MRRLIFAGSLLVAGSGVLLAGALPASAAATITVTPAAAQSTVTSTAASLQMHAVDTAAPGVTVFAWSASGLPTGLVIDPGTGLISGTPTVLRAASAVTVTASDMVPSGAADTGSVTFTWAVTATASPTASPSMSPTASPTASRTASVTAPSATPSMSPSMTAPAMTPVTPRGAVGTGGGGSLGNDGAALAAIGAAMVVMAGGIVALVWRRRRNLG